jgi:hypothetical protein
MTSWRSGEPTLADIEREFPRWRCTQGNSGLYYAEHQTTRERVSGEDPLDLRDQIKAAEARRTYGNPLPAVSEGAAPQW